MHLAIREFVYLKNFQAEPLWISAKLDIPLQQAKTLWEECLLAGWIEKDSEGRWIASDYISLGTGQSNEMLKNTHQEVLKRAAKALSNDSIERRYNSFSFFSISNSQLEEAKLLIKNFRQQLTLTLHSQDIGEKTKVVCFASQLFAVTSEEL